jgi:hypothetical protein
VNIDTMSHVIAMLPGGGVTQPSPMPEIGDQIPAPTPDFPNINITNADGAARAGSGVNIRPVNNSSWGER